MDFKPEYIKNTPNQYRPLPFWSWNDKLSLEETKRQIGLMHDMGMGGFFMHARGGLQTEYMGDDWFENVSVGVTVAKNNGMTAWAYDENGWPSGFGNGIVNGLGEEYQQKYLRMEFGEKHTSKTIYNGNGIHFYYEVNPFYVDNLDEKVVKHFINEVYEPYYKKYGSDLNGFFTDEPEVSEKGIPWSFILPEKYMEEYGEDLLPVLEELFIATGDYKETRKKFWFLITKLFSKSYFEQIYTWCEERNMKLTGHLVNETTMRSQLTTNGACMPHYRYFHIPGVDWLGRELREQLPAIQVASVAAQLGRKHVLTESFALCGHGVSFSGLRRILEWQMVRGASLLCQHLQGYSLRGIRKRDYPPAMSFQQPWWGDEYRTFIDVISRTGMLISEGKSACRTLLIHPQTSAWICFDANENSGLRELDESFAETISFLERKHVQFHLGDETIMKEIGYVEGKQLVVGEMCYDTVIIPEHIDFLDSTKKMLEQFQSAGGIVLNVSDVRDTAPIDNEKVLYHKRIFEDFNMHYFVNSTCEEQYAQISVDGDMLDVITGEMKAFSKDYVFSPMDSLIVFEYKKEHHKKTHNAENKKNLDISGEWTIEKADENILVLDFCDCYFDEQLIGEKFPVTAIQEKACEFKKPVNVRCVYEFNVSSVPDSLFLVCETPEAFEFVINGKVYEFEDCGCFKDISFRKANIASFIHSGSNVIEANCYFLQSDETYYNLELSRQFASVRNKFTYDMELEPIYIVGDFGIKTTGEFKLLDLNACKCSGDFVIEKSPEQIYLKNMEQQGFPFFSGRMTVKKEYVLDDTNYKLKFQLLGLNGIKIKINKNTIGTYIWDYDEVDISPYLSVGKNTVEISVVNNLRNMLGPHHLKEGECHSVRPSSFIPGQTMWHWRSDMRTEWSDDYCFIETSILPSKK